MSHSSCPIKPQINRIIGVAAGKGGVGKSTLAANLALFLQGQGLAVGLLDADLYGPSLRRMIPEAAPPEQRGEWIRPARSQEGIKLISMAFFKPEGEASAIRAPIANRLIEQFLCRVEWGTLDYLIIDFPPGTGDIQLTLSQKARLSGAIMVTTPQEVALMDVRKAIHLFQRVGVPLIGVIENMSYYHHEATGERLSLFGEGGGERLAAEAGIPLLGQLPVDPLISLCGDKGLSIFSEAKPHLIDCYSQIAYRMSKRLEQLEGEGEAGRIDLVWKEN